MRIISTYILKEYSKPFLEGVFAFVLIMFISHLFEKLDTFTMFKPSINVISLYLIHKIPQWAVQILPVAILLGALFSLHSLSRTNQIMAMKASGINLWRLIIPLLCLSLFISIISFVLEESIVPSANQKSEYLYNIKIKHRSPKKYKKKKIIIAGDERRQYVIDYYNHRHKKMYNVTINQFSQKSILIKRIDAERAEWQNDRWIFYNGIIRIFDSADGKSIIKQESFEKKGFNLSETPDYFGRKRQNLEEMNLKEISEYIKLLEKNGFSTLNEKVTFHSKIAFPFTCLICMLLGIPFGLWGSTLSKSANFALCLFISFIYWGTISVGQALGMNKILPPILAAWIANLIFGMLGIILIVKTKK